MSGVLAGMRVVEVSAFVAVPFAGTTLAHLGADVIRVDPLGGGIDANRWPVTEDGTSLYWNGLNQGKRSVALDLATEEGRETARRLATAPGEDAGILITNLAPGWLDLGDLRARRPDLIAVVLRGNPDGSIAVDYTVNAATGFPAVTGAGPEPINHVLPAWDLLAGSLVVTAVLAAERHRSRTGEGQLVELSLADVALAAAGHLGFLAEAEVNDADRPALGNDVYGQYGRDFATSDGRRVMVAAFTPRQWRALVDATGTRAAMAALARRLGADFDDEAARFAARADISAILRPWFARRPLADVRAELDRHGVLWGPYQTFRQLLAEDPRASTANPLFSRIDQPGAGAHLSPGSPLRFGGFGPGSARPAPVLGEHTAAVLAELLGE